LPRKRSLPYRIVDSKTLYKGRIVTLVKDRLILDADKKKLVTRELLRHPGAAVILPFLDEKNILLLRQFRYAAKGDLWEVPAGTLEKGEPPLACAKRELEEETGYRAKKWTFLASFLPAPGISDELMTLYRADRLFPGAANLDHDEFLVPEAVPIKKARRMALDGRIRDAKTLVAVLWPSAIP
jgi:ADP-ribose pyrophosphatase